MARSFWVVEKNWVGPINPDTRRVLIGHAAMEKGRFGNNRQARSSFSTSSAGDLASRSALWRRMRRCSGTEQRRWWFDLQSFDISEMSPSIQNKLIAGWIDGELNPRREARLSAGSTYMERTREQMLGSGSARRSDPAWSHRPTGPRDRRRRCPDGHPRPQGRHHQLERSPDHLMKTIGDVVALAPVIGAFKYSDASCSSVEELRCLPPRDSPTP